MHLLALDSAHVSDGARCLVINGLTDGDWLSSVFAHSVGGWFDSGNVADD